MDNIVVIPNVDGIAKKIEIVPLDRFVLLVGNAKVKEMSSKLHRKSIFRMEKPTQSQTHLQMTKEMAPKAQLVLRIQTTTVHKYVHQIKADVMAIL